LVSGRGNSIFLSILPGLIKAGSSESILFVAMITCRQPDRSAGQLKHHLQRRCMKVTCICSKSCQRPRCALVRTSNVSYSKHTWDSLWTLGYSGGTETSPTKHLMQATKHASRRFTAALVLIALDDLNQTLTSPMESKPSIWFSSSNMVLWISLSPPD